MEVTFNGKNWPMVLTMGALIEFKHLMGHDAASLQDGDIEGLLSLCYCCLRSSCRADGRDFPYSFQEFADRCTIDEINAMSSQIAAQQTEEAKKKESGRPATKQTRSKA